MAARRAAKYARSLARAAYPSPSRRRSRPVPATIRASLQHLLDAITGAPAWVVDQPADIIALNPLGRALLAPLLNDPDADNNNARFIFLSLPRASSPK